MGRIDRSYVNLSECNDEDDDINLHSNVRWARCLYNGNTRLSLLVDTIQCLYIHKLCIVVEPSIYLSTGGFDTTVRTRYLVLLISACTPDLGKRRLSPCGLLEGRRHATSRIATAKKCIRLEQKNHAIRFQLGGPLPA